MSFEVLTEMQIKQAYIDWCNGISIDIIADKNFVSTKTLFRAFKKRGLKKVSVTNEKSNGKI